MARGGLWAGHVYGTNTGNFFLEIDADGDSVQGTLRFMDAVFGIAILDIRGTLNDKLLFTGIPRQTKEGVVAGELSAEAELTPEGNLRGTWSTTLGTGGTFLAYPHDPHRPSQGAVPAGSVPEQLYSSNVSLGAIRLNAAAIDDLVHFVRRDFLVGRPVMTYVVRGNEVTKYFEDFKADADVPPELRYLKITVQEQEAHGINKVVVVELNAKGENVVRVQGINESWVVGKAEATARMLREGEKTLATTFKKFGLSINTLIFAAMVVTMPSIPSLLDRALFAAVIFGLLNALLLLHQKYIPNAIVAVRSEQISVLRRVSPTIVSWLVAASASVAAAVVYKWLAGAP